ncbi:amylo-alpha-1,6-glucosidase [Caulobacter segnis]
MEERGFYGIAVDGQGKLCRVLSSNPGHLLFCGLPSPERARKVSDQLLSAQFNSGWGVRTLATGEARFNPISYRNGSVWPHDTALCVMGLSRYGERDGVVKLTADLFETASRMGMRLPELILRLSPLAWRTAGGLSGRLPAPGLGRRVGVHDAAGVPGHHNRRQSRRDLAGRSAPPDRHRPPARGAPSLGRGVRGPDLRTSGERVAVRAEGDVPPIVRSKPSWD